MAQNWSDDQKHRILDDYRQTRMAYCPSDNTPIDVKDPEEGQDPSAVVFACPTCGNSFVSSELS
jgi:predicted RNA-binding Zn-ribbon protein involved in translation (DUF1610 family)